MTNTAKRIMGVPWGERTRLIDKVMVYAFSLDVRARSKGPYLTVEPEPPRAGSNAEGPRVEEERFGVRHLFGETTVTTPDGLRCDVPTGNVDSGEGEIGDPNDPLSSWLSLRVRSTLEGGITQVHFDMTGVVNFDGGLSTFRNPHARKLSGQAFLASGQESSTGTYRWLGRRQIFGVGRVDGARGADQPGDEWLLRFSFDIYAAL